MKYPLWAMLFTLLILAPQAGAWHDKTHLAAARAGGLDSWYNAAGPDLAKIKAGNVESYNHWFNNNAEAEVTAGMVMDQIGRYNQRSKELDSEGHVYGAIIASLRAYDKDLRAGKYARYHLAYCVHYLTDFSQPLHNIAYDDFNQAFHDLNDGIVEAVIQDEPHLITRHLYRITLSDETFEADLAREIARIANLSRRLGYRLRAEKRVMTKEEACVQLGHSASLIRAVLRRYP